MKRRHGINTSHTKHLNQSQDTDRDNPATFQVNILQNNQSQLIQLLNQQLLESEPIVVRAIPTLALQVPEERNSSTYFVPDSILPYNLYNISSVKDDSIEPI